MLTQLFGLDGRVVLVGGASRGIGRTICDALHGIGATVAGVSRSLDAPPAPWTYRACDLRDEAGFSAICDELTVRHGQIAGYVHAAGVTSPSPDQSAATFRETIDVNLTSAYACSRRAARAMTAGGSIVLISSIASHLGFPENPGYVASKGGLSALVRALAVDYAGRQIRVNSVAPGYVRTAMTEASFQNDEKRAARGARTVLGRWGEPQDIVGAVIFLLADASSYMTGQEMVVDGGWSIKGL